MIQLKRVYEAPAESDGTRVLVERLWPRGLRRQDARLDAWEKAVAPSTELRRWYGHDRARWEEFQARYERELAAGPAQAALAALAERAQRGPVTLLFASRDAEHSSAAVLLRLLSARRPGVE